MNVLVDATYAVFFYKRTQSFGILFICINSKDDIMILTNRITNNIEVSESKQDLCNYMQSKV